MEGAPKADCEPVPEAFPHLTHSVFPTSLTLCALHILDNSGPPKHACAAAPVPSLLQAPLNPPQLCDVPSSTESVCLVLCLSALPYVHTEYAVGR